MKRIKNLGQHMLYLMCFICITAACSETDDVASALLYQDDGDLETGSVSFEMVEVGQWDLNNGNILYGIDMVVRNTLTDQPAEDIRLSLVEIDPTSFVQEFSPDRRDMSILFASETSLFDDYWCFNCSAGNEVRVGNYYVIIGKGAGSGQSYNLRFTGRYDVESSRTDLDFTRSIRSVDVAPFAPASIKSKGVIKE